jgi:H+/Cl- antiporter ClcA
VSEQPSSLSGSAYLRLVGLGAVIGIPAAFLAALFLAVVHDVERWLWDSLPSALGHSSPPWYLVILLPAAGACVVLLARSCSLGTAATCRSRASAAARRRSRMRRGSPSQRSGHSLSVRCSAPRCR